MRIFRCLSHHIFGLLYSFISRRALGLKFTYELGSYLTICLTIELNALQILFLNLWMPTNNSVMNYEDFSRSIIVGVSVSLNFLPTSSPSCMSNSNMRFNNIFANLIYKSIYTVWFFILLLGSFDHSLCYFISFLLECDYTCTIISSILKELNTSS